MHYCLKTFSKKKKKTFKILATEYYLKESYCKYHYAVKNEVSLRGTDGKHTPE